MTDINAITATRSTAIDHSFSPYPGQNSADSHVATMGFDDFLDMVNPLQHIPVVSSIYRAVTGETINPISRIAGDTLYGGVFGLAAAGIGAVGAISDEVLTASNDGKSASATVIAALFGTDDTSTTQLATATPDSTTTQTADAPSPTLQAGLLQTPARQSPILEIPDLSSSPAPTATAVVPTAATSTSTMAEAATMPALSAASDTKSGLPLDRSKLAYGGVMDTAMMQNALQNQSLALALTSGQDNLQAQHALHNGRFATNSASTVTAPTQQSASLPLPGSTPSLTSWANNTATPASASTPSAAAGQTQAQTPLLQSLPSGLRQSIPQAAAEMKAIKGLDQYRNTAQSVPTVGAAVDITN